MKDILDLPAAEQVLASAIRYFIEGQEEKLAYVLLSCSLQLRCYKSHWYEQYDRYYYPVDAELAGPRAAYDEIMASDFQDEKSHYSRIRRVLGALLPVDALLQELSCRIELIAIDPDWRRQLAEVAKGGGISNQGNIIDIRPARVWNNLKFRSQSEIRIAEALERAKVMFLPNCMARIGLQQRWNKEPDFLVCIDGKWGVLEVDGEPYHPASRTVQDHERDRLFLAHGVKTVQHFDASYCYEKPDEVVKQFVDLLRKA